MVYEPETPLMSVADLMEELVAVKAKVNDKVRSYMKKSQLDNIRVEFSQSYPPSAFSEWPCFLLFFFLFPFFFPFLLFLSLSSLLSRL